MIDLRKLAEPFPVGKISWRVGALTKNKDKAIGLAYIDARDLYERLDDVCGPESWQIRYPHAGSKTCADIGINLSGWVWKSNGAGDSNVEAEKGAFSDAAKRAGVVWGIGRYLYDMPNIWVTVDQYKKITPDGIKILEAAYAELIKGRIIPKFEYTIEHRVLQRDFTYGLAKCNTIEGLKSYMAAWDGLEGVPIEVSGILKDEYESRLRGIPEGKKYQAPIFSFINTKEAIDYMGAASATIDKMVNAMDLGAWVLEEDDKIKSLDASLKAAKYQKDEGSPSQRVMLKYQAKLDELKEEKASATA